MNILFYYRGRESLAIEYLSSILKNAGHKVELIFDPGLDNTFYYHNRILKFFSNENLLIEKAVKFSPDLIAFSSTTNEYPYVCRMAEKLKKKIKAPVIVGGIHPTAVPEFVLNNPHIDMICRGEGEEALLELVTRMSEGRDFYGTRNIWFKRDNGTIIRNDLRPLIENLDSLPFPDKELFFRYGCGKTEMSVMSGRGCFFKCSYCFQHFWKKIYHGNGKHMRRRSVKNLIEELKVYKAKYNAKSICFEDDLFVSDKAWLEEFSHSYAREINLPFFCNISPTLINEQVARDLRDAGCRHLYVGIDATSESIRRDILKRITPESDIKTNIQIVRKHNIPIELSMIFGWPHETPEDMWAGVRLVDELRPTQVQAHILYPYPGTEILSYCKESGLVDDEILRKIYNGDGGMVVEGILDHPHKDLAYVLGKLLPLYIKSPLFLKPFIKMLMRPKMKKFANIIYVPLIPFLYPLLAWTRIKELFLMAKVSIKIKIRKTL
jgi:radical SAM superfamily enzyme YgiQ (UPF0313 family)